jgi:hypothetical protein
MTAAGSAAASLRNATAELKVSLMEWPASWASYARYRVISHRLLCARVAGAMRGLVLAVIPPPGRDAALITAWRALFRLDQSAGST